MVFFHTINCLTLKQTFISEVEGVTNNVIRDRTNRKREIDDLCLSQKLQYPCAVERATMFERCHDLQLMTNDSFFLPSCNLLSGELVKYLLVYIWFVQQVSQCLCHNAHVKNTDFTDRKLIISETYSFLYWIWLRSINHLASWVPNWLERNILMVILPFFLCTGSSYFNLQLPHLLFRICKMS